MHRPLHDGDRLEAVERIASVGEPEQTRLGPGRRWVVENTAAPSCGSGELVAVERFSCSATTPPRPRSRRQLTRPPSVAHVVRSCLTT